MKEKLQDFDNKYLERTISWMNDSLSINIITSIQQQNRLVIDNESLTEDAASLVCRLIQVLQTETTTKKITEKRHLLSKEYPRTLLLSTNLTKTLPDEIQPIANFLLAVLLIGKVTEDIYYQALLVAHGNTTASSIQAVANKMR